MTTLYLQTPQIANLAIFLRNTIFFVVYFDFQAAFVGEMQETDEAEAGTNLLHLLLRIRLLQTCNNRVKLASFGRISRWSFARLLQYWSVITGFI